MAWITHGRERIRLRVVHKDTRAASSVLARLASSARYEPTPVLRVGRPVGAVHREHELRCRAGAAPNRRNRPWPMRKWKCQAGECPWSPETAPAAGRWKSPPAPFALQSRL